ncbi:hypothetical protein CLOM_g3751 [Closterium sp. NIES-68]|nr:hypothetical protein CLOM_g2488 [Closterium sp. NIES-68]GJP44370.1 hypothetical protein CLOM_g3751 [Closterium sp. NIES-68]
MEEEREERGEGGEGGEREQGGESEEEEYAAMGGGRGAGEEVGILASLRQQWQQNVEAAREAAEARQAAERLLNDLRAHHTTKDQKDRQKDQSLAFRELQWKRRHQRDIQEEVLAVREEISRVVAAFQEVSLAGVPERTATDRACADVAQAAALSALFPEPDSAAGSGALAGGSAGGSADLGGADWVPALGEAVYVRRFGSSMRGTVVAMGGGPGEGSGEGGSGLATAARLVTVQLGNLRLQVQRGDLLPADADNNDGGDGGSQTRADGEPAGRRGVPGGMFGACWEQDDGNIDGISNTNGNSASKRGGRFPSPSSFSSSSSSSSLPAVREAAVQTARNTVDVRGRSVEDALAEVDLAVQSRPPGAVLFIVHGLGTGVLRAAVLKYLSGSPLVSRHEPESRLNIGCTIAYIG